MKADEEFAIDKVRQILYVYQLVITYLSFWQAKLVKQEQQSIDAQFEKKHKGAETAQKMCVSILFNPDTIRF